MFRSHGTCIFYLVHNPHAHQGNPCKHDYSLRQLLQWSKHFLLKHMSMHCKTISKLFLCYHQPLLIMPYFFHGVGSAEDPSWYWWERDMPLNEVMYVWCSTQCQGYGIHFVNMSFPEPPFTLSFPGIYKHENDESNGKSFMFIICSTTPTTTIVKG